MVRRRYLCGYLALGVGAFGLGASSAQSRPAACGSRIVHVGPVFAIGRWRRAGSRWISALPVTLDRIRLAGGGTFTIDTRANTIASAKRARWTIGSVQFLRAPVSLHIGRPLTFTPTGAVKGLKFAGTAMLAFATKDAGTANLARPTVAGGVSGGTTLSVSRRRGFDVRTVDVSVGSFGVGRLAFEHVDFHYAQDVWSARQVQTAAADGASSYQAVPAAAPGVAIPPSAATLREVDATPVDAYGRTARRTAVRPQSPEAVPRNEEDE